MQANAPPPYDSIITQIGRENKFSAEICILRTVGDAGPYNEHPYEKEPKATSFLLLSIYYLVLSAMKSRTVCIEGMPVDAPSACTQ